MKTSHRKRNANPNDTLLQKGIGLHNRGQLAEAATVYAQVLSTDPNIADAWHLAGVIAHQVGQHQQGIEYIQRAISLQGDVAAYYQNLATTLLAVARFEEALIAANKCLKLNRDCPRGWNVRGIALQQLGNKREATESFENAIENDDNHVDAWLNLGRLHLELGKLDKAESCTQRVLQLNPRHLAALNNLGTIHRNRCSLHDAIRQFEAARKVNPESVKTLVNLGIAYQEANRFQEAQAVVNKALQLEPTHANAWSCVGKCHQMLADTEMALHCFRKAHTLDPTDIAAADNFLFALNLSSSISRRSVVNEHIEWANRFPALQTPTAFGNYRLPHKQLRIGYVSPDFCNHPLVSFVLPILQQHDREQVETYCYTLSDVVDETTKQVRECSDHWRSLHSLSGHDAQLQIVADEIDILIDLAGHTANNRLSIFAHRAAPVQVSMLGYLNTTGLRTMDYVISDEVRDPVSDDDFYVETVWRLPDGGSCWLPPGNCPEVRPAPVKENGFVTLGSMHRPNKLTDETLALWASVMKRVENARLRVFHSSFAKAPELRAKVHERLVASGIAKSRFEIVSESADGQYLSAYHNIDLLLECTPWSSGTTALESMWMGVPIPTIYGDRPMRRPTASALHRMGLPELVADSAEAYTQIVAGLCGDASELLRLRTELRERMRTTICDADTYVGQLEAAYREMWQRWCDGH
ncbi:MAG: tetratricopeptide repeat protein [Planctomycetaceae bacterium]